MRLTLAMCVLSALIASPTFAGPPAADGVPSPNLSATPAPAADPAANGQQAAGPQQLQDSIQLANGKVQIGATFYADWAYYAKTGFAPQFVTQTNFPGTGNDGFNTFDVHRTYINLFYSPTDRVTLRLTPNIYRNPAGSVAGDKVGAVSGIASQADGNLTFRLKYGYLQFNKIFDGSDHFKGTNFRFGQQMNPLVDWEEALWDYRFVALVPWNYLSLSSTQVGAALNGGISSNGKTYLDYQVGIFNDVSFHAFEYSEQKQFMVRGSLYPMGAKTRFQGLGITGFYDHGYANTAPDSVPASGAVPSIRTATMVHYTTPKNGALIAFEYDWGKNAMSVGNMFSGAEPADVLGLATTAYAGYSNLAKAILAPTSSKQQGYDVFGRVTFPGTKASVFGMFENFKPNTDVVSNPLDFNRLVLGLAYRVSPRWRMAFSSQNVLYTHDNFTYPAASIADFSPSLAAANPNGIPNAVSSNTNAIFVSFEFTF